MIIDVSERDRPRLKIIDDSMQVVSEIMIRGHTSHDKQLVCFHMTSDGSRPDSEFYCSPETAVEIMDALARVVCYEREKTNG